MRSLSLPIQQGLLYKCSALSFQCSNMWCMKQKYHNNHICNFHYEWFTILTQSVRHISTLYFTSFSFSSNFSFYRHFSIFFFLSFFGNPVGFELFMFAKRLNMVSHSFYYFNIRHANTAGGVFATILSNLYIDFHVRDSVRNGLPKIP